MNIIIDSNEKDTNWIRNLRTDISKIEIPIDLLKNQKRYEMITVHPKKGQPFKRKQLVGRKESEIDLKEGRNNLNYITKGNFEKLDELLKNGEWDLNNSLFYFSPATCIKSIAYVENKKIYGMAMSMGRGEDTIFITLLEINNNMRRQGYGIKLMKEIVKFTLDSNLYNNIELVSFNKDSDNFYDAIGMKKVKYNEKFKFTGDKKWMKEFLKST